jgi:glycosyltransferase involved in cell wall biosynthesis
MAAPLGFAMVVVDPRRAFASEERLPGVSLSTDWPDEAMAALAPDARTAVVTLTHDPKLDDPALDAALKSEAFYIGALGSRRTHARRVARLKELGHSDEVITFVNRNLEPYRGFHVFMRALPEILRRRPNARCLIVGRDDVSYGSKPKAGGNWRQVMLSEVGAQLPMDRVHFLGGLPYADYLRVMQVSACHV